MPNGQLQLGNVLSETCSRDNPSAELEYICEWGDRWYYSGQLVGGLIQGSYYPPQSYPYLPGLICNDCKMEKVGTVAGLGPQPMARLTASFGIPKCKDPSSTDLLDLAEITIEASGEGLPLSKSGVKWGNDAPGSLAGQTLRDQDIQPTMLLPYAEVQIKIKYVQEWNLDDLSALVGQVNSSSVSFADATFDPEELLLIGLSVEQTLTAEGYPQLTRVAKIGIRRENGWNKLYIPDQDAWATTNPTLYDSGNFSILFQ